MPGLKIRKDGGPSKGRAQGDENAEPRANSQVQIEAFNLPVTYVIGLGWCLAYGFTRGCVNVTQKIGQADVVHPPP